MHSSKPIIWVNLILILSGGGGKHIASAATTIQVATRKHFCAEGCESPSSNVRFDFSAPCSLQCATPACVPSFVCTGLDAPAPCPRGSDLPWNMLSGSSFTQCSCFPGSTLDTPTDPQGFIKNTCMDSNTGEVFCQFQQFLTSPPCPPNEACPPTKCEMNWVTGVLYDPFAAQNRQCFSVGGYVSGYAMPT
eukprot:722105-Rhodomonas_salina.1